jgi:hypothetical protein
MTALALLLILLILPLACNDGAGNGLTLTAESDGGKLYIFGEGYYQAAVVSGSWQEMGRQYGALLAEDLQAFHIEITHDMESRGVDRSDMTAAAREYEKAYSENLRLLMDGMAETSGLSRDAVRVLNFGMMLLTQLILGEAPPSVCSGLAAWDGYTPDGKLIFGRNWDINRKAMLPYMKYLGVVVFKPDGAIPFANVHPLGNIYLETGINSRGVFLELNNGEQSDPVIYGAREDTTSFLVEVLSSSGSLGQALNMLTEEPADVSYILQVADTEKAVSMERPTFGARVREGNNGLLAAYNSFIPPYPDKWDGRIEPPPPLSQDPRYENLLTLANSERFIGKLDAANMMDLLKVPIEDGGALHDGTVVQVVAEPETLTIWIRGVDYSDFEKLELAGLFKD